MRIAFYAPLKPPTHPVPSGDRRMARLLLAALGRAGHEIDIASTFRSWEPRGNAARQIRLQKVGTRLAHRLIRRFRERDGRALPDLWFTYHVYYKAPDWLGPTVADRLGIPYVVAEASHAPKRAGGAWDIGHQATVDAIRRADTIFTFNRDDLICLPDIIETEKVVTLPPFLDSAPYGAAADVRTKHRAAMAARFDLDPTQPWLLTVAMMRPGDKLKSYTLLARALERLARSQWQIVIAGDGPSRDAVRGLFAPVDGHRLRFTGELPAEHLPPLYAACDLFVWPAEGEAFGMSILEAQAAGLPVIAGDTRGVPDIVSANSGVLVPPRDVDAFAAAVESLLGDPPRRRRLSAAARANVGSGHGIDRAAAILDGPLRRLVRRVA